MLCNLFVFFLSEVIAYPYVMELAVRWYTGSLFLTSGRYTHCNMSARELPYILNLANSIMGVSLLAMPFCFMRVSSILLPTLAKTSFCQSRVGSFKALDANMPILFWLCMTLHLHKH